MATSRMSGSFAIETHPADLDSVKSKSATKSSMSFGAPLAAIIGGARDGAIFAVEFYVGKNFSATPYVETKGRRRFLFIFCHFHFLCVRFRPALCLFPSWEPPNSKHLSSPLVGRAGANFAQAVAVEWGALIVPDNVKRCGFAGWREPERRRCGDLAPFVIDETDEPDQP